LKTVIPPQNNGRRDQDGSIPWTLLPWMLLALFSYHDSLGMMNLAWMGIFAVIIFGEKIWSKGIWMQGQLELHS